MIAVFYLVVTSGIIMNIHHCMGKIASVTFNHEKDHDDGYCSTCGMNKTENHCCNDEMKTVKLNDSHQSSTIAFELASLSSVQPEKQVTFNDAIQGNAELPVINYTAPPPKTLNKLYRAVNTYLI